MGVRRRSNEVVVCNDLGVHYIREVKRMALEHRWKLDNLGLVKFAPWHRYPYAEDADGEIPAGVSDQERANSQLPSESSRSAGGLPEIFTSLALMSSSMGLLWVARVVRPPETA